MTLTRTEKIDLENYVYFELKEDADLFDFQSNMDSSLTYQENLTILKEKIALFKEKVLKEQLQDYEESAQRYSNALQSTEYGLKRIFSDSRIVGLASIKNSGKTNNLLALIKEARKQGNKTPIYVYGFKPEIIEYLKQFGCIEVSEIRHLIGKKDSILICDEFQRLKLNDRRYTEERDEFKNYVYHNNIYVLLSSPDIREFNSVIGGIIEKWIVKTLSLDQCINGSQLKREVEHYQGNHKHLGTIEMPKDQILILNSLFEQKITCEYIKEADTKLGQIKLF